MLDNTAVSFFELLKAGLWEQRVQLSCRDADIGGIYILAEQQSVIGLVAAGFEYLDDSDFPSNAVFPFVGRVVTLEKRNTAMNSFIGLLVQQLNNEGIKVLLLKGQGIAQCYERPMWRESGDVDFLLDENSFTAAKELLSQRADRVLEDDPRRKHFAIQFGIWTVELHGTIHVHVSSRSDKELDRLQAICMRRLGERTWIDNGVIVPLPAPDEDVVYVFAHILQHFYHSGIGLRQVCDWCRLLKMYSGELDAFLLEKRLRDMRFVSEWKTFAAFAVDYLGAPAEIIPLYSNNEKWSRKAVKVLKHILESGNMGHNLDCRFKDKYPFLVRKIITLWLLTSAVFKRMIVFPANSFFSWSLTIGTGLRRLFRSE